MDQGPRKVGTVRRELYQGGELEAAAVDAAAVLLAVLDRDERIVRFNRACERLTGRTAADAQGRGWVELFADDGEPAVLLAELASPNGDALATATLRRRSPGGDGQARVIDWRLSTLDAPDGSPGYYVMAGIDITDSVATEHDLRERERQLCEAQRVAHIGSFEWDIVENRVSWTDELYRIYGLEPQSFGATLEAFLERVHPADRDAVRDGLAGALERGKPVRTRERILRPDGEVRTLSTRAMVVRDDLGTPQRLIGVCHDITDSERQRAARRAAGKAARRASERLAHATTHDALTGLPNRALLVDRLEQALERAAHGGSAPAVLHIDVDRLKRVNRSLGYHAGDELLRLLAERVRATARPLDTVARFGADEIVVVSEVDERGARELAERIAAAIRGPVPVGGRDLIVTASIGIAVARDPEEGAMALLREAMAAMHRAQEAGVDRVEVFRREMSEHATAELEIEQGLRRALSERGLRVVYQPIVDLVDDRPLGVEALARLALPNRGDVAPGQFIAIAEDTGLIHALGRQVLAQACRDGARFLAAMPEQDLRISVNLSAYELAEPGLPARVAHVCAEAGLEPSRLMLEVTETSLIERPGESAAVLESVRALGVIVALDDFGTGYSSLAYLRHLPVDLLKIDRSFVAGLPGSGDDLQMIAAITSLAHALDVRVLAEGVETAEQLTVLQSLGVDVAQGFLFSRPCEAEDVVGVLRAI